MLFDMLCGDDMTLRVWYRAQSSVVLEGRVSSAVGESRGCTVELKTLYEHHQVIFPPSLPPTSADIAKGEIIERSQSLGLAKVPLLIGVDCEFRARVGLQVRFSVSR
jgi:hypothetical protein